MKPNLTTTFFVVTARLQEECPWPPPPAPERWSTEQVGRVRAPQGVQFPPASGSVPDYGSTTGPVPSGLAMWAVWAFYFPGLLQQPAAQRGQVSFPTSHPAAPATCLHKVHLGLIDCR